MVVFGATFFQKVVYMSSYFIEDIGTNLDNNDGSEMFYDIKNADLKQGKEFLQDERSITVKTLDYLPYLEETSMPGLTSINEAFIGYDSLRAKNTVVGQNISENENAFNKTLSEYSILQKEYDSTSINGTPMRDNDMIRQLSDFKNQLIYYAKKINNDMSSLRVDDDSLREYILKKQSKLNNYIRALIAGEDVANVSKNNKLDDNTLDDNKLVDNKQVKSKSKHYHYLMWVILLITLVFLFIYILTSNIVMNTLVVIICLMTIYILARAINNK